MNPTLRATALAAALAVGTAEAAPPQAVHIALLGDSLALGAGDESGKGIAGRIEPELKSRGVLTTVTTNLGVNGATTRDLSAKLKQPAVRESLAGADAIVLSIGANDVRRALMGGSLRSPFLLVEEVLTNVEAVVTEVRSINPKARILILGAYAPVPDERAAAFLAPLATLWDAMLAAQFSHDSRIAIVPLADIVATPDRLSKRDSFHPGGEAYQAAAGRIAALLADV